MGLSWDDAFSLLRKIGDLPYGWDGNGSKGTDARVWKSADMLLNQIGEKYPAPFTCPIPGGTLQLEWTHGDRHLEIEFVDLDTVLILRHDMRTEKMKTDEIAAGRVDLILKHLDWLGAAA